ncbi:MAG: hypothetical protein JOZ17_09870, partial [Acetobacteraceae bacterium]|nr:hypothetical protein [Acetobacteraceae bacterium]
NPAEITVLDLVREVLGLTRSASPVVRRPLPVDDPQRRCPDIALARRLLGWSPTVPLREGLRRTIAFYAASRPAAVLKADIPQQPASARAADPVAAGG